jgi:hypothetical protein
MLPNVVIPDSVTTLGTNSFYNCTALKSVTLGTNVSSIKTSAFSACSELTNITIPDSLTNIADNAFLQCYSLASIALPNVISIEGGAFDACFGLTCVVFGTNLASIGNGAFAECRSLTNVTIPDSVTTIGASAFDNCHSLSSISIGEGVENVGNVVFNACYSLTNITVNINNPIYSSLDGALFNRNQTSLIAYPPGKAGSYTIPNGTTNIGYFAFGDCPNLTEVIVPATVNNIASAAFGNSPNLTNVYFIGDAPVPTNDSSVFTADNNATVYYLPGTAGWGATFDGRPTVLWNPQAQTGDDHFGIRNNQFGFNVTGGSNLVFVVEACTNLTNPVWIPLSTNLLSGGLLYFSDPQWTNFSSRFYKFSFP